MALGYGGSGDDDWVIRAVAGRVYSQVKVGGRIYNPSLTMGKHPERQADVAMRADNTPGQRMTAVVKKIRTQR